MSTETGRLFRLLSRLMSATMSREYDRILNFPLLSRLLLI